MTIISGVNGHSTSSRSPDRPRRCNSETCINSARSGVGSLKTPGLDDAVRSGVCFPVVAGMAVEPESAKTGRADKLSGLERRVPVSDRKLGLADCVKEFFHRRVQIYALYCGCDLLDASCVDLSARPEVAGPRRAAVPRLCPTQPATGSPASRSPSMRSLIDIAPRGWRKRSPRVRRP